MNILKFYFIFGPFIFFYLFIIFCLFLFTRLDLKLNSKIRSCRNHWHISKKHRVEKYPEKKQRSKYFCLRIYFEKLP